LAEFAIRTILAACVRGIAAWMRQTGRIHFLKAFFGLPP
jgi:hypothetical protein